MKKWGLTRDLMIDLLIFFGARIDASNEGLGSEQVDIQVLLDYASLHFFGSSMGGANEEDCY